MNASLAPRVFGTLREAIHATASQSGMSLRALAGDLDWSPSELSMRIALGGDSARAFPADDAHLVRMMQVTKNYSVLATLADLLGFDITPKEQRMPEIAARLSAQFAEAMPALQLVMEWGRRQQLSAGVRHPRRRASLAQR